MNDRDLLIWAAGLFDGEGCITYAGKIHLIVLCLSMTDKDTVDRFHMIFKCGSLCSQPPRGNQKTVWHFTAKGKDAFRIAKSLRPYLFTKAQQADLAIEWGEKCMIFPHGYGRRIPEEILFLRELICDELRVLNKRGVNK